MEEQPQNERRERQHHTLRQIDIFGRHAMPGMMLRSNPTKPVAQKPPARPSLIYRCACGQPISYNKRRCRACRELLLVELGQQIETEELLTAVLSRNPDLTMDDLRPHLRPELRSV